MSRVLHPHTFPREHVEAVIARLTADSLGIPRAEMPQVGPHEAEGFIHFLRHSYGLEVDKTPLPAVDLSATQKEMNPDKIIDLLANHTSWLNTPTFVSEEQKVLDGHHRWAGWCVAKPEHKMACWKVRRPIKHLLEIALHFNRVQREDVSGKVLA